MTEAYRSLESTIRQMKSGATEVNDVDESVSVFSKSLIEAARTIVEADKKDDKKIKKTDSENNSDDDDTDGEGAEGDDRREEDDENDDPQDKMTKTGKTKTDVNPETHDDRSSDDDNTDETKKSNRARNAENKKIGVKESIAPSVAATLGALSAQARTWALDEGYKKIETGEPEKRTPAQARAGRHISGLLGSRNVDVLHHPKGGLVVRSKMFGRPGNGAHLRGMSKTLDSHSIPHRYEEHPVRRHGDQLYVLSDHAHELGNRLAGRSVREETQIDELSKEKLGKYIRKASGDLGDRRAQCQSYYEAGRREEKNPDRKYLATAMDRHRRAEWDRVHRREHGIDTAVKKLTREGIKEMTEEELLWIAENITKEEFERLDELSRDTLSGYVKKAKDQGSEDVRRYRRTHNPKHIDHFMKRSRGVDKAEAHLSKEEEERISELASQIDELSKEKLGRYVNKSINDVRNSNQAIGRRDQGNVMKNINPDKYFTSDELKYHKDNLRNAKNREAGIKLAAKKLAKEDVEEVEETYHGIDEKHLGFKKLEGELSHEKGVKDPGALAASIGMKKYGKKSFEKHAHAGVKEEVEEIDEGKEIGGRVKIHDPRGFGGAFHGKTGTVVNHEKDGRTKMYRENRSFNENTVSKTQSGVDRVVERITRESQGLDLKLGKLD